MRTDTPEGLLNSAFRRGWFSSQEICSPSFMVADHSARVGCLEFIAAGGHGLVVKHGFDHESRSAVRREGLILSYLARNAGGQAILRALPTVAWIDRRAAKVAMERIRGPGPLDAQIARGAVLGSAFFREAGRALAQMHRIPRDPSLQGMARHARRTLPWQFQVSEPPSIGLLRETTAASIDLIRIIQRHPDLHEGIREAAGAWSPTSFIHGDLRWENCLVQQERKTPRLRIIDWESAGCGDPAWDLGAFLGEGLRVRLFGARLAPHSFPALPRTGRKAAHPALAPAAPFWRGYRDALTSREVEKDKALLTRAVRFSGVWLLGRIFELAEAIEELDTPSRHALRLAAHVLTKPQAASRDLYGCTGDASRA